MGPFVCRALDQAPGGDCIHQPGSLWGGMHHRAATFPQDSKEGGGMDREGLRKEGA